MTLWNGRRFYIRLVHWRSNFTHPTRYKHECALSRIRVKITLLVKISDTRPPTKIRPPHSAATENSAACAETQARGPHVEEKKKET